MSKRTGMSSYLACSVHNLSGIVLALVLDDSTKRILNCRVVALDEVMVDKSYGE